MGRQQRGRMKKGSERMLNPPREHHGHASRAYEERRMRRFREHEHIAEKVRRDEEQREAKSRHESAFRLESDYFLG